MSLVHARGFSPKVFTESPWYSWLEPALSEICGLEPCQNDAFPGPEVWSALHAKVARARSVPELTFVPSPAKKPRRKRRREPIKLADLYEGKIVERNEVPTRLDDWHDLFNALAFIAFPEAKWELHRRQYLRMKERLSPTARTLPGARTREQDALSLFDEGGLVVMLPPARIAEQPADPDAFEDFILSLHRAGETQAIPFGHALFEHLVLGRSDMAGTVVVVPLLPAMPPPSMQQGRVELRVALDQVLAARLRDPGEFTEPSRARGLTLQQLTA